MSGGGGGSNNTTAPRLAGMQIQTSTYGNPVALVYGRNRVAGNLLWYGDFTATAHTTTQSSGGGKGGSSSSKSTNTTYTYSVAAALGLCEGTISNVYNVWADKTITTLSALGLSLYTGTIGQAAPSYMTTNHAAQAVGYAGSAYLFTGSYQLGSSASLPNHSFEVAGLLSTGPNGDAMPPSILIDYLTNAAHGVGLASAKLASWTTWQNYCGAYGIWLSPVLSSQEQASNFLDRIAQATNTALFFSEGVLKAVPYCDTALTANGYTYTPTTTAIYALTDDDFLSNGSGDPVIVSRSNPADAFNSVSVQFNNRANNYNTQPAAASDQSNIDQYGLNAASPVTLSEIADPTVAQNVAQLILQRGLYVRNTYKFVLGFKYCLLEQMDIVTLTESTGTGLNAVPVQISSIEEDQNGNFNVEAMDYLGGISHHVAYPSQQPGGYTANYLVAPGSVVAPVIFDAPGRMTKTGYEVWLAASNETAPNWGGFNVWVSTDGVTYSQVGTQQGGARYGVLTAGMNANTADPDTTNTCAVDLTNSGGTLTGGSSQDADLFNTLCYCDGELFSYQTANLTATYKYTLGTYLRRSIYGTSKAAHASGKSFVRIDGAIQRYAYDASMIGKNIWVKFQSFNIYGGATEGLASIPAYTYTIQGPIGAPPDVTGAIVSSSVQGSIMSWTPCPTPHLAQYEVRLGTTWSSATFIGNSLTTQMILPPVAVGTSTWLVKAIDKAGNYSVNADSAVLNVSAPNAPTVTQQVIDNNVLLYWTPATGSQPVTTYEIRKGTTWAGATVIGKKSGLFTSVFETVAGVYTYWVAAIDTGGNYGTPGSVTCTVNAPPDYVLKTNITSIFNGTLTNALVEGSVATGTLGVVMPVNTAETFAQHFANGRVTSGAVVAGGTGYAVNDVVALTTGTGSAARFSITTVSSGVVTGLALVEGGSYTANPTASGATTAISSAGTGLTITPTMGSAWTGPSSQVTAGFPIYIEPDSVGSASYVEFIDYGTTLASSKITATYTGTIVAGAPVVSCDILTSPDNVTYTTYAGATATYATSFRYVKVRINVSGGSSDIYKLTYLNIRLDIKLKNDAGRETWTSNPATITFNTPFINVTSINLTVMGQSAVSIVAITDFVSVANPTTFKAYLFNSTNGAAPTGPLTIGWTAKGY